MSTFAYAMTDSATMLRRELRHLRRSPLPLALAAMPVVFLLLFVYVFGGTLGNGLGGPTGGRAAYVDYVTPAIILLAVGSIAQGTAISVAVDMTGGIIARFRTMAISRGSVLTGHVLGSTLQTLLSIVLVLGVALLIGFRPDASAADWLALAGLLVLLSLAITWLSVALGLVTKSVEAASNLPLPLILLPFLSSGFVPTDSMPAGLRWVAENQPFTPIIETIRGLLLGTPIGHSGVLAVGWCLVIALGGYLWAKRLFRRDPIR